jgi:hypothetical protein
MLVREWTTDEKGRLMAIWVQRDAVFTEIQDAPTEINTKAAGSEVQPAASTLATSLQVSEQTCDSIAAA